MTASPMADPLTVCALVPYPPGTTPSQRFRIEQWTPHLAAAGVRVDIAPFAGPALHGLLRRPGRRVEKAARLGAAFARRLARLPGLRRYDAVVVHRAACLAGPALVERLLARLGRPVVFDFDDAVYLLHTAAANRGFGWLKFPGKTAAICRLSDHVVAGNGFLADFARRHNPGVTVIPSSVDTARFRPRPPRPVGGRVVVGWTGSSTSQTYLELFAPVLRRLTADGRVELRVHSDRRPDLPGVPYTWRPWAAETEAEELAAFDVGIMPMPDTAWARGKCAMKALLYMATGVPAVCSAVGANREVIRHGENGLLAQTEEEWQECVIRLVGDAALRARLGAAARRTVEEEYSAGVCAARFADVLRAAVGRRRYAGRGPVEAAAPRPAATGGAPGNG